MSIATFAVVVALHACAALSTDIWDDALFFQRIGRNIVEHGVAAWNVGDGPVHGNTSQLFQVVAAAVVAVAPTQYQALIKVLLGAALFAAFVLSARPLLRSIEPLENTEADEGRLAILLCGLSAPTIQLLAASGMETLVVLAVLALFLLALARVQVQHGRLSAAQVTTFVAAQVLVYLARPDAAILSVLIATVVLFEPGRRLVEQRRLLVLLWLSLAGILVVLGVLRVYYGTAFPLSFYLKSRLLSPYDEGYVSLGAAGERRQLLTWLVFTAPFAYIGLFRRQRWTVALLAGAAAFVTYHAVSTVGIMGYHTRFFVPASLPVILAAAIAWPTFARGRVWVKVLPLVVLWPAFVLLAYHQRWIEAWRLDFHLGWLAPRHYLGFGVPLLALVLAPLVPRLRAVASISVPVLVVAGTVLSMAPSLRRDVFADDAVALRAMAGRMNAMTGIYDVRRCIAEPTHIYHSELGVPGVLFPDSKITDLTGLMNPRLVFGRPAFDDYCLADRPEVLFLPHRTHKRLNDEIKRGRCIQGYARPQGVPESTSTLFIRRDRIDAFDACRKHGASSSTQARE